MSEENTNELNKTENDDVQNAPSVEKPAQVGAPQEAEAGTSQEAEAGAPKEAQAQPETPKADASAAPSEKSMQEQLAGAQQKEQTPKTTVKTKQPKRVRKLGDLFTGRRKSSIARIKLVKGSGKITINSKDLKVYFPRIDLQLLASKPLHVTNHQDNYDVVVSVKGGGISGQAGAVSLGIARALDAIEPNVHTQLRAAKLLTRDSRAVERKKYGLHKARRATQFSKR